MTDKAKDNHVQRVPPPEEGDLQKSDLPPDGGAYRERSARERTSALPPDKADYRQRSARERTSALPPDRAAYRERSDRERKSALPPDYRDLRQRGSVLPPDYHDPRKSVLPPDYHDPEKSALPPDKANHPETVVLPEGEAPARQEAERYYAEHVQLGSEAGASSLAALQEALNKGARQSRKLVGVVHDPSSQANVILVWDTEAFISG
jgi:hypothetical protein